MGSEDRFTLDLALRFLGEGIEKSILCKRIGEEKTLHIHMDFRKGGEFVNDAGQMQKAYDTEDKTWCYLNFFSA